jgi:hypothetical protein
MDENGNRTCKTGLVGFGAVMMIALLVLTGYSAMKLHKLEYEVWHASIEPLTVPLPQPDKRVSTLFQAGVRWDVGMDQSNVWIIIDATNEPQWIAGTTNSKVVMKRLTPDNPKDTKQLE